MNCSLSFVIRFYRLGAPLELGFRMEISGYRLGAPLELGFRMDISGYRLGAPKGVMVAPEEQHVC